MTEVTIDDQPLLPMPIDEQTDNTGLTSRSKKNLGRKTTLQKLPITSTNFFISLTVVVLIILTIGVSIIKWEIDNKHTKPRVKTGVIHKVDKSHHEPSELPNCRKTFVYRFVNPFGLGSELGIYSVAAVAASASGYTMILDDSKWIYGRLSDYFDIPPPPCRPPSEDTPRTAFKNLGSNQPDHVYGNWEHRDEYAEYMLGLLNQRALDVHAVWNLMNHREERTVLPATQNLHYSLKPIFDAKSEAFRHIWRPNQLILDEIKVMKKNFNDQMIESISSKGQRMINNSVIKSLGSDSPMAKKMISVQFRLGDKKAEIERMNPAGTIGMATSSQNSKAFLEVIRSFVPDWKKSESLPSVFIFSDDVETVIREFEDDQSFYPLSQRFPLLSSPNSVRLTDHGFDQAKFDSSSPELRRKLTIALVRDITFAVDNSEGIVCSASSNICNMMFLLRGSEDAIGPQTSIRSVDVRWYPTTSIHEMNQRSLDMIKNRKEILEMIPRLAADEKNYIDL
ncbi:hypothetical protein DFH28DRAFT_935212 [Melampsora americana]|nr:hypothetical protein DFH28DRAFT_935212 [Melampsora americana]